jgi:hypothetical protein
VARKYTGGHNGKKIFVANRVGRIMFGHQLWIARGRIVMSLRIVPASRKATRRPPAGIEETPVLPEGAEENPPEQGDEWGTRIAKLIPAEALGLYGSAVALVPATAASRGAILWMIVAVCCLLTVIIRYRATRDATTREPQMMAVGIAVVSFIIWLAALGAPVSPIVLPKDLAFTGPLVALLWGTMVPYFYIGD